MDTARERSTDTTVSPHEIAARIAADPGARGQYRKAAEALECRDCKGTAWFISGRRSGQGSAFGAHHADGCNLASSRPESEPGDLDTPAPALTNEGDGLLMLDSAPLGEPTGPAATRQATKDEDTKGRSGRRHSAEHGIGSTHNQSMNLRSLLRHLATEDDWLTKNGHRRVPLGDRGTPFLRDAVWSMDDFDPADDRRGKLMICWGRVRTVGSNYGMTYFNQGVAANSKGAIALTDAEAQALAAQYTRHGITSPYDFTGGFILAIGHPATPTTRTDRLNVEAERDPRGYLQVAALIPPRTP